MYIEIRMYYVFAVISISTDVFIKFTKFTFSLLGKDVKLYIPTLINIACWIISYKANVVNSKNLYLSFTSYLSRECEL